MKGKATGRVQGVWQDGESHGVLGANELSSGHTAAFPYPSHPWHGTK